MSNAIEIAIIELEAVEREIGVPSKALPLLRALPNGAAMIELQAAITRLSTAMRNPVVQWNDSTCIDAAVIDEATRRLSK